MTDKELDNYMKTVNPNFDSHIEKGTIEMSNEYYNLLEEKMARLINEKQELKKQLHEASLNIQEMTERDIYCPSSCDKLEKLLKENKELKKQLEEYKATNKVLSQELTKDKVLQQDCLTTCCGIPIGDIPKLISQQKEFIKYLEDEIKTLEKDILETVEEMDIYI